MAFLLRLPLLLLELLLRRLFGGDDASTPTSTYSPTGTDYSPTGTDDVAERDDVAEAEDVPPATFTGAASNGTPPVPTAEEAIERRFEREAADAERASAGNVPPPTPLRPIADTHVDTEPTVVESFGEPDDVGSTITIAAPWPGYDGDTATAIVNRLRGADTATKGVVALYEASRKNRRTIMKAAS
jgi:hypothetical protein